MNFLLELRASPNSHPPYRRGSMYAVVSLQTPELPSVSRELTPVFRVTELGEAIVTAFDNDTKLLAIEAHKDRTAIFQAVAVIHSAFAAAVIDPNHAFA